MYVSIYMYMYISYIVEFKIYIPYYLYIYTNIYYIFIYNLCYAHAEVRGHLAEVGFFVSPHGFLGLNPSQQASL